MEPTADNPAWQPFREPLRATLTRTGLIALGIALAGTRGNLARLPMSILLALWPAFGGHWVEIFFLNWLRPRIPAARNIQVAARLCIWFVGGTVLLQCMRLTAMALTDAQPRRWPAWWVAGLAFVCIELIVHAIMQLRSIPSFFNGRG